MSAMLFSNLSSNSKSCDLSVLGYSSKIFRDDEKAKELEQGKYLIPWMGDTSVTIDRFDVRAYLSDLTQLNVGKEEEHKKFVEDKETEEQLCDDERYKALLDIEGDEEMYEEEDLKRIKQSFNGTNKYSQVSYNYDEPGTRDSLHSSTLEITDASLNPKFEIPPTIVLPTSSNLNQIIEKTAACVFEHGKQMEIYIKTRQSNNNKFNFMNFDSALNPYYQFILNKMKTGNFNEDRNPIRILDSYQLSPKSTLLDGKDLVPGVCSPSTEHCPYNMLVDKILNIHKVEDNSKVVDQTVN